MIAWMSVSFQETIVEFETIEGMDLQVAGLMELQRESTSVGVNTFLVKKKFYLYCYYESVYSIFRNAP